jgi:hypothetical protein
MRKLALTADCLIWSIGLTKKIVLVTLEMKAKLARVVFIDPEERLVVLGVNEFHVLFKNKYIV